MKKIKIYPKPFELKFALFPRQSENKFLSVDRSGVQTLTLSLSTRSQCTFIYSTNVDFKLTHISLRRHKTCFHVLEMNRFHTYTKSILHFVGLEMKQTNISASTV